MPGFLLHVGATAMCPHAGQVTIVSSNTRVMVSSQPVATFSDTYTITACPFTIPGPKPQPCIKIQWIVPATRVLINRQPAVLLDSTGLCLSPEQIPQGPPNIVVTQIRVKGM